MPERPVGRHRLTNTLPSEPDGRYLLDVYWFARPPYLRQAAAVLLVLVAAWIDLRPTDMVPYPFAAVDLPAGTVIDERSIEWRDVPRGIMPSAPSVDGTLRYPIKRGEPVSDSLIAEQGPTIPDGWWALSTTLPGTVVVGQTVQLVVTGAMPRAFPGIVIEPPPPAGALDYEDPEGLVAVPGESATVVAAAMAEGTVSVLLGPAP